MLTDLLIFLCLGLRLCIAAVPLVGFLYWLQLYSALIGAIGDRPVQGRIFFVAPS